MFQEIFPGIFKLRNKIFTLNLVPGRKVYGEKLVRKGNQEFREWNPKRSKLGAAIKKGLKNSPFNQGNFVLYLGSAEGTTPSHISDIIGEKGVLFGVDVSARVMRKFLLLCEERKNLIPIMDSANHPEHYSSFILEKVDVVFQDVSQKNQSKIFIKNCKQFLKKEGFGMLSLKARSIDVSKNPKKVFVEQRQILENEFKVIEELSLEPFEKDHAFFVVKLKN